jgi:hypothetical protein
MDPDDLLRMLDLDGKPPDTPRDSGVVAPSPAAPTPPAAEASPTALEVDAWGLRRGRDLIAESDRLRKAGTDEFAAADRTPRVVSSRWSRPHDHNISVSTSLSSPFCTRSALDRPIRAKNQSWSALPDRSSMAASSRTVVASSR